MLDSILSLGYHIAQVGLKLTTEPRETLNFLILLPPPSKSLEHQPGATTPGGSIVLDI